MGVGCAVGTVGAVNVGVGLNESLVGLQKIGYAMSIEGYPIKGTAVQEYTRLINNQGYSSTSPMNSAAIFNPIDSAIIALGGTEQDYNDFSFLTGVVLGVTAQHYSTYKPYYEAYAASRMYGSRVNNVVSKYDDFYDYEYNAYTNPGPLAKDKHNLNFYGGRYNERVLKEDKIYYRAGSVSNKYGRYFVETPPKSVIQVRMDTAVKPYWTDVKTNTFNINQDTGKLEVYSSPIEQVYAVKIPAGTVVYEGPVGYQGGMYLGGMETNQIFMPDTRIPGVEFFKYTK